MSMVEARTELGQGFRTHERGSRSEVPASKAVGEAGTGHRGQRLEQGRNKARAG